MVDLVSWAFSHPELVLVTGIAVALLLTFYNISNIYSIGRLTLAGVLVVAVTVFYLYADGGMNNILSVIAKGIGLGIIISIFRNGIDMYVGVG